MGGAAPHTPMANPFTDGQVSAASAAPAPALDRAAVAQFDATVMSGASWFWWIGGLSLINTVLIHSDSETTLAIGLGFTLMADAIFKEMKVVALIIDAIALGTIFGLGFFARKGHFWAFVVGIILYGLDALIYVLIQGWIGVAIHGLALFYMFRGAAALRSALKAMAEPPPVVAMDPQPVPVRIDKS